MRQAVAYAALRRRRGSMLASPNAALSPQLDAARQLQELNLYGAAELNLYGAASSNAALSPQFAMPLAY